MRLLSLTNKKVLSFGEPLSGDYCEILDTQSPRQ